MSTPRTETLWLPGRLPGLNDLLFTNIGARIKHQKGPKAAVRELVKKQRIAQFERPVLLRFEWREPNRKRDPDGFCAGGAKVVIDALKTAGVLKNDGWQQVAGIAHSWCVDSVAPGVLVTIEEAA
jgi:Holliday junction resolvase RusA-like endonuclease